MVLVAAVAELALVAALVEKALVAAMAVCCGGGAGLGCSGG